MERLGPGQRAALGTLLREAREKVGWNQEEAAEKATEALQAHARKAEAPPAQQSLWISIEVSRHHVHAFEDFPAQPLSNAERRARLLGLVLALGVDRAQVNQLAGGV